MKGEQTSARGRDVCDMREEPSCRKNSMCKGLEAGKENWKKTGDKIRAIKCRIVVACYWELEKGFSYKGALGNFLERWKCSIC